MFNVLVSASLRNRLFVLLFASVLVGYGGYKLTQLPVDVFPDLNRPTVTLLVEAPGLAPEEVEQLVVYPLETALNGMPGAERLRSASGVGLGVVWIEFGWATDIYLARQQVNERLALVRSQMPPGVEPQMGPISSIMGEIVQVGLSSDGRTSPMDLREIADFTLRPRLLAIPGVAQVIPIGGEVRQYQVVPDIAQLNRLSVTHEELERAIKGFGANTGGGFVDQNRAEYVIRNIGRTTRIEDLRSLVVATRAGQPPILLGQVARVEFGARFRRGDGGVEGKPAVIVSIQKQPGADTVKVTAEIERVVAEAARSLPQGVKADRILFRQAGFIELSVANLQTVLVEAVVVVAIVLFAFLLNVRTTAISILAIPISLLVTVLVFSAFGLSINTMTLGGLAIAIGELVDDAVVDVENVFRRLKENREAAEPRPALEVVAAASQEVRSGIVYATAIVILVFLPLFALSGIEGKLFAPLGVAYIVSILASLVTSITVTPVLCLLLLPRMKQLSHRESPLVRVLKRWDERVLRWSFGQLGPLLGIAGVGVLVAGVAATQLPRTFLPTFNEGTVLLGMTFRPGISLEESARLGAVAERLIMGVPEVRNVGRRTGRAELDEHAEGVHANEISMEIAPSGRSRGEILADIRRRVAVLPASFNVGQPIQHRLEHMLSGVNAAIAVKVFGEDLDTARSLAEGLRDRMARIPGLVDIVVERTVPVPQVQVQLDYARAALYGVTPAALASALETLSNGQVVSQVVDGAKRFDVVLRLSDRDRTTEALAGLLVETPRGRVPLVTFADVVEADGPNQVLRENGRRRIVVQANAAEGADMGVLIAAIRSEFGRLELPAGYNLQLEGTFQAQEEAARTIAVLSGISLVMVFVLLFSRYRSVRLALLVMGGVPLALIGSVAALWIAGQPLSVASMVGFITLTGISARNGILKVSHYINLVLLEGERFGPEMVVRGSLERLSPVLMTALSAGFALIPLMIGADQPGKEILHPVAITIFGGLISATVLDTLLTPTLFLAIGRTPVERIVRAQAEAGARAAEAGQVRPAEAF
ncbi:MAG: efflux RND transporter permease subunit [Gemmatimonadaceae bacterium]|nr:efflux RND transporter permease subunit [Acetobacteraceae bacterium]